MQLASLSFKYTLNTYNFIGPNIVYFLPLQVYTNGYVSLTQRFLRRYPPLDILKAIPNGRHARRYGFGLLAPFWTNSDCTQNSKTYYHVYDSKTTVTDPAEKTRTDTMMKLTKNYITKYTGEQEVNPDWVLVVTWVNNFPLLENDFTRNKVWYF